MSGTVGKIDLPYVHRFRDQTGVWRTYFRKDGKRKPLPDPSSPAFTEAYRRARGAEKGTGAHAAQRVQAGTVAALVADFLRSPSFTERRPATQKEYRRIFAKLAAEHGELPVAAIRRLDILKARDARAETPGAANTFVRHMKLLMTFAIEREMRTDNPAAGVKMLRVGEWRAWSFAERDQFTERWAPGTMQRRAYALALYTTQRRADLVAMTQAHRRDGRIEVAQSKTGERLWIPEHPVLTAEIDAAPLEHMALLTTRQGKAFDAVYFGAWFAEAIDAAGLPDDCVLHGLRKSGLSDLAEAGCTEDELRAISGHATSRMVSHYTKSANRSRLADQAMGKVVRMKRDAR